MQMLFKRLRHLGTKLPAAEIGAVKWWIGELVTATEAGTRTRSLTMRHLNGRPDLEPLARIYQPAIAFANRESMLVRGIEHVEIEGRPAAVVQEWLLRPPPMRGGALDEAVRAEIHGWGIR